MYNHLIVRRRFRNALVGLLNCHMLHNLGYAEYPSKKTYENVGYGVIEISGWVTAPVRVWKQA